MSQSFGDTTFSPKGVIWVLSIFERIRLSRYCAAIRERNSRLYPICKKNIFCSKYMINIGNLNIQGICGKKLGKFSELQALLTSPENYNLHVFGLSETKLKAHKLTNVFQINGFQTPFRKDNFSNGGGGLIVYVRNGINARRREDLETNDISCLMLEISPTNSRSFLVRNMYRPPNATVDFNDRFEDFIDVINNEFFLAILIKNY